MESQNDYEINEKEEKASEEYFDLSKAKLAGRNVYRRQAPNNTKFHLEEFLEVMGDNSERDQRDKYSETFEKINEDIHDIFEKITTKLKNLDSIKIAQRIINEIKPKLDEIKVLSGPAQEIVEECKNRNMEDPVIEALKKEIDDFEKLNNLDLEQAIKQLIGKKTIEIGKTAVKGMGELGLNMIGSSVLGVGKIIKGVKQLGEGSIKFKDKDSKIKQKREKYYIAFDEEKSEQSEPLKNNHKGQDIRFDEYRDDIDYTKEKDSEINNSEFNKDMRMGSHSKKDYVEDIDSVEYKVEDYGYELYDGYEEEEYEEEDTEKTEKDNFIKRKITGIKDFGAEVGKKFKWVKDRGARQAFKNKQKEKFVNLRRNVAKKIRNTKAYKNAETNYYVARAVAEGVKEEVESIPEKVGEAWKQVKTEATEVKDDIVKEIKDITDKAKDAYEEAKDKHAKRRNDNLIKVLEVGEKFSKGLLTKIENGIKTREEKNKEIDDKNTIKGQINKNENTIDY